MHSAIEKADGSLLLRATGARRYCLWPSGLASREGWLPALSTRDRVRYLTALMEEVPGITPVTFIKGEVAVHTVMPT